METTVGKLTSGGVRLLWAQPLVLLLTIPFSAMQMRWLPSRLSDFGYGFMSRLGVCFAIVILVWCYGFTRQLIHWRSPVFLVSSVISADIAYAVNGIAPKGWQVWSIVVVGAVLLSLSQKLILEYSWIRMVAGSIAPPVFFYLVILAFGLALHSMEKSVENYWPYFWQIGYLLGMFVIPDFFEKQSA